MKRGVRVPGHLGQIKDFNKVRRPREHPRSQTARRRIVGICERRGDGGGFLVPFLVGASEA